METNYLLKEFLICQDSETGERQDLGDVETGGMGFLGSGREGERMGMVTPIRFDGNS